MQLLYSQSQKNSYPSVSSMFIEGPGIGTFMPAKYKKDFAQASLRRAKELQSEMIFARATFCSSPKNPVRRVSGANIIVTTAKRCIIIFMTVLCDKWSLQGAWRDRSRTLTCFVMPRFIIDRQLSCNDFNWIFTKLAPKRINAFKHHEHWQPAHGSNTREIQDMKILKLQLLNAEHTFSRCTPARCFLLECYLQLCTCHACGVCQPLKIAFAVKPPCHLFQKPFFLAARCESIDCTWLFHRKPEFIHE